MKKIVYFVIFWEMKTLKKILIFQKTETQNSLL